MKNPQGFGAGFKPALRREIGSIRHGTALGGFETRPKPRFVFTSEMFFTLTFMASEATPDDETAPMFVYERAMPAMGGGGVIMRCLQRKCPLAGMARSYTGKK